jgi:hypothetical protein
VVEVGRTVDVEAGTGAVVVVRTLVVEVFEVEVAAGATVLVVRTVVEVEVVLTVVAGTAGVDVEVGAGVAAVAVNWYTLARYAAPQICPASPAQGMLHPVCGTFLTMTTGGPRTAG